MKRLNQIDMTTRRMQIGINRGTSVVVYQEPEMAIVVYTATEPFYQTINRYIRKCWIRKMKESLRRVESSIIYC